MSESKTPPIAEMPCWEILFPGFDGGTDKTDNLVKRVKATTAREVGLYLARHHPEKALGCKILPITEDVGFGEGLDLVIDGGDPQVGGVLQDVDPHPGAVVTLWKFADDTRRKQMEYLSEDVVARYLDPELLDLEEYRNLRTNSYGYKLLYPKLDNEALVACAENHLNNCAPGHSYKPAGSYDATVVQDLAPLMLDRLKELTGAKEDMLARRIEVGLVNPLAETPVTVTIDLGLSLVFSIALDKAQELKGPELVYVLTANAHDYLGVLLGKHGGYTPEKFPDAEEMGSPLHFIDFDVLDAHRDDQGPPPVPVNVEPPLA